MPASSARCSARPSSTRCWSSAWRRTPTRAAPAGCSTHAGVRYHYLEYGSYLGQWRRRNALKMWTGWPTFPMVFVRGTLVGGASDLAALIDSGELQRLLG